MTRPPLIFAHANGFPAGSYRKLFAALEPHYRIAAPDQLGHDPRYPLGDNWTHLVDELLDFIEAESRTPVLAVGHSLGGVLTFLAALRRPQLFRAFIMLDPPAFLGLRAWAMRLGKLAGFQDRLTPAGKAMRRRAEWPDVETAIKALGRRGLFRDFDRDCMRDYVEAVTVPVANGIRLRYEPAVEAEIFRHIPHNLGSYRPVQVPGALVRAREADVARLPEVTRLTRRHRMHLLVSEGGHMFPLERPLATAELIRQALTALTAPG